jgi:hypothetical protein
MMELRTELPATRSAPFNLKRELLLLGAALAFGLLILPLLIWLAGHFTLGPYTHGDSGPGYGPLSLYGNYFTELARGQLVYWVAALGPVPLLLILRLWLALLRFMSRS